MQDNLNQDAALREMQMMGIDPNIPFYDLNLAGKQGVPAPTTGTSPATINAPTFSQPDTDVPALDRGEPNGINFYPKFTTADLTHTNLPHGLDTTVSLPGNEQTNGLEVTHDIQTSDPLIPDLQHPELAQQMYMQERPGELAASALEVMHLGATYQQLDAKIYPEIFMDQTGVNNTRSRHMDLLMRGLDAEEQER